MSGGRKRRSPYVALLPLRFFLAATFLYAGLDKLLDPAFLQATGRGSIGAQMAGWVEVSPLGGAVAAFLPYAVPVGLLIAFAELCVGIGALVGLAYRLAALGGTLLSLLFFLTASWAVHPFYLGNDLPYAFAWGTLFLAGSGGLLTVDAWLAGRAERSAQRASTFASERRLVVRGGVLALAGLCVAGLAGVAAATIGRRGPTGPGASPEPSLIAEASPTPSPSAAPSLSPTAGPSSSISPSPRPGPSPSPSPSPSPGGKLLARIDDVTTSHPVVFQDPYTSDPGILLRTSDGRFVAFDAVCTHAACTVEFDPPTGYLVCPCHQAVFDPARDAKAIEGPTFIPLMEFPIVVDQAADTIRLAGE